MKNCTLKVENICEELVYFVINVAVDSLLPSDSLQSNIKVILLHWHSSLF